MEQLPDETKGGWRTRTVVEKSYIGERQGKDSWATADRNILQSPRCSVNNKKGDWGL